MSISKYLRKAWTTENIRPRLIEWRKQPATLRIERPTRLDRARSLGYRAKQGIFVVRQRIGRGGRMREKITGGRRPKHNRRVKVLDMNYKTVAEKRSVEKYPNCEVLNSYLIAKDGISYWFEVILVDRSHPAILKDKQLSWIAGQKGRVHRGLTSSSRKSRGLRRKGFGAEKVRPSRHGAYKRKVGRQN